MPCPVSECCTVYTPGAEPVQTWSLIPDAGTYPPMRRWLIILIEPRESGNIGAAARVLKNFGAGGLRVVAPRCEVLCGKSRAWASGAAEVLRSAEVFPTLGEALADRELSIGLTGVGGKHHRMDCIGLHPDKLIEGKNHYERCALVFGREERGMESHEMEACDFLWSLPTHPKFPSLNLAQAVAVSLAGLAEAERQLGLGELGLGAMPSRRSLNVLAGSPAPGDCPATNDDLERLARHAERLMQRTGWEEGRRTQDCLSMLRNLLVRGGVTRKEVNLLHGICRQAILAADLPELFEKYRQPEEGGGRPQEPPAKD